MDNIDQICQPLDELAEREVTKQELEDILDNIKSMTEVISVAENEIGPKQNDIGKIQKDVKAIIGQEVEGRIKVGQSTLDVVDTDLTTCNESHNLAQKKIKNFKD